VITSNAVERLLSLATPASGAVVMGTGIVSVAMASDDRHVLSLVLVTIAAAIWIALGLVLAGRLLDGRRRVWSEARMPAALTSVAATAVLGARATGLGWSGVAAALFVLAGLLWLILLPLVVSRPAARVSGVAFMATVSTQSLAVLAAQLAVRVKAPRLLYVGLVLLVLGLLLYLFVLARFDFRQLFVGRGDHWVSGGALAISALGAARITLGARGLHVLSAWSGSLDTLTLTLWALAAAWLPALIFAEALRPRLGYDVRRWATVFPVGMYAACSFDTGRAAGVSGLISFAQVWVWLAFALWLIVMAGSLRPSER
jgi:tellurite resistance protein TehA-like permease